MIYYYKEIVGLEFYQDSACTDYELYAKKGEVYQYHKVFGFIKSKAIAEEDICTNGHNVSRKTIPWNYNLYTVGEILKRNKDLYFECGKFYYKPKFKVYFSDGNSMEYMFDTFKMCSEAAEKIKKDYNLTELNDFKIKYP